MIYHISYDKRSNGNLGGVEFFGYYLEKAVGCRLIVPSEVSSCSFKDGDMIIGDGSFVCGFDSRRFKVVSVCHGLWYNFALRTGKLKDFQGEAEKQHQIWKNPNIHVIACSYADRKYIKRYCNRDVDRVILHGIDTELYAPVSKLKTNNPLLVMHSATNYCKEALGKLGSIGEKLEAKGYRFEALNKWDGRDYERYQEADIYINCSLNEGNSFAVLGAMSCNVPMVGSCTGLLEDTDFAGYNVGEILSIDASADDYVEAVDKVAKNLSSYNPRAWVLQNATFEIFKKNWLDFLSTL